MKILSASPSEYQKYSEAYLAVREKEGRVLTDDAVRKLPEVASDSPYFKEWLWRKRSYKRLAKYLQRSFSQPKILDLGCGNGWMSYNLQKDTGGKVVGMEVNMPELAQAERLFANENISFYYGNITEDALAETFDVIVISAAFQYFEDVEKTIQILRQYLNPQGEIHITDTQFYSEIDKSAARLRSEKYYADKGIPEMSENYFHHSHNSMQNIGGWNKNAGFGIKLLQKFRLLAPFPWYVLKKS